MLTRLKDAFYFSHDSNARHDLKIQALRSIYGMKGYGMYWVLVEMMRDSKDYTLPFNQKFAYLGLSKELECTIEEAKQFINDCIYEFGLFICDEFNFWSDSLNRRMDIYNVKRDSNRNNGAKGGRPSKQKVVEAVEKVEEPKQSEQIEKKEVVFSIEVVELTDLFCNKLRENNEKAKIPSDLKKWSGAIDALNRLDGYSFDEIEKVLIWSQSNHFWKTNILSATKLREKFAQLLLNMQEEERKANDISQHTRYGKQSFRSNSKNEDDDKGYASDLGGFTVEDAIKLVQARGY